MTIRTICEVCNKVVRYTDNQEQESQAISSPEQFCEGHISEPNEDAIKAIMRIIRAHKTPNNRFFISKADGHLISSAYLNSSDGSFFPSIPKGSYEIGAGKEQARSYEILRAHLHGAWIEAARIGGGYSGVGVNAFHHQRFVGIAP